MNIIDELTNNPWAVTIVGGIIVSIIVGMYGRVLAIRKAGGSPKRRSIEKDTKRSQEAKKDTAERIKEHQVAKEMEQKLIKTQEKLEAEKKRQDFIYTFYRLTALEQMKRDIIFSEMTSRRSGEFNNFLERIFEIAEKKTKEDASYMILPYGSSDFERNEAKQALENLANRNICHAAKKVVLSQLTVVGGIFLTCCGYFVRLAIEICALTVSDLYFENGKLTIIRFKRVLRYLTPELRSRLELASAVEMLVWQDEFHSLGIKDPSRILEFVVKKIGEIDYCNINIRRNIPHYY